MVQYHFRTSAGPSLGPIEAEEFQQRQEAGEIRDETMVWRSGLAEWTTYAALRSLDERVAQPRTTVPPPLPVKKVASAAPRAVQFLTCSGCGKQWPESLLFLEGSRRICGNCQRQQKEKLKSGQRSAGGSLGVWALKWAGIVLLGGSLFFAQVWWKKQHPAKDSKLLPGQALSPARP